METSLFSSQSAVGSTVGGGGVANGHHTPSFPSPYLLAAAAASHQAAAALQLSLPQSHVQLPVTAAAAAFNAAAAFPFLTSAAGGKSETSPIAALAASTTHRNHFTSNGMGESDSRTPSSSPSSAQFSRSSVLTRLTSGLQEEQSVSKATNLSTNSITNSKYSHSIASLTGGSGAHAFSSPPPPPLPPTFPTSLTSAMDHNLQASSPSQIQHHSARFYHQQQLHNLHAHLQHGFTGGGSSNNVNGFPSMFSWNGSGDNAADLRQSSPETTPSEKFSDNGSDGTSVEERDENRPLLQLSGIKGGNSQVTTKPLKGGSNGKKSSRTAKGARLVEQ